MRRKNLIVYLFVGLQGACGVENQRVDFCTQANYLDAAKIYASANGLNSEWIRWMYANHELFAKTFCAARKRKKILTVAVSYMRPPAEIYREPWEKEEEHMTLVESMLEEAFLGWDFDATFEASERSADIVVGIGVSEPSYAERPKNIYLHREELFVHEIAHLFYAGHHYADDSRIGKGDITAPSDTDGCAMDATAFHFCSAHSFVLGIPYGTLSIDYLNRLMNRLSERYKDGY